MAFFGGVRWFNALNVQFHSDSFIQRCLSMTIWSNNVFHRSFQKLFSCSAIIFIGLVESHKNSESEPSTFPVMNILKKPQAAIPSSFNIEVRPISSFRLPQLPHFLTSSLYFPVRSSHPALIIIIRAGTS